MPTWLPTAVSWTFSVASIVMSSIALWRTAKWKKLDLRLQLRKETHDNDREVRALPEFIDKSWQSHIHVASAIGTSLSGGIEVWKQQAEKDREAVRMLRQKVTVDQNWWKLKEKQLEDLSVAAHAIGRELKTIRDRYETSLAEDASWRETIRANAGVPRNAK